MTAAHLEMSLLKDLNSVFKKSFQNCTAPLLAIKYSAIINEQNAAA